MVLYTCGQKRRMAPASPTPARRPARRRTPPATSTRSRRSSGYRAGVLDLGTSEQGPRGEVKRLSGTNEVPILVLDNGEVISGSGVIARWAKEHPRSPAKSGGSTKAAPLPEMGNQQGGFDQGPRRKSAS